MINKPGCSTIYKGRLLRVVDKAEGESDISSKMKSFEPQLSLVESFETKKSHTTTPSSSSTSCGDHSHHTNNTACICNKDGTHAPVVNIDLVTPHWTLLSNNDQDKRSNKEAVPHAFPDPSNNSTSSSSSSPPFISSCSLLPTWTSCASANENSSTNDDNDERSRPSRDWSSVSEEEIVITPANLPGSSHNEKGNPHSSSSHHQSKAVAAGLVVTPPSSPSPHNQRKVKRRRRMARSDYYYSRNLIEMFKFYPSSSNNNSLFPFGLGLFLITASLLVQPSHEQAFFSPVSDEWDGSSFRSGTYGNGYTCVNIPVNFTLCKNIGYTKMMIPNLLGHDSLQEAEFHAKSWVPLLGLQCHPDTQLFLCSLFSPICLDRPIYPCRSLCQGVQAKCEPRMLAYNYPWPSMLKCDQFPEDHDLCIRPGAANKSDDPELDCPSCNQAHTCENIVDNFCRADFVFRAKYKKSRGALVEFRKERFFKPREGNRRGRELRTLSLDSKDDCCATKMRQGFPYIVMGVKRDNDYIITFAMQWNPKDKVLKNAVRTFRSMDCTNPLPMSVTAAGGKGGGERNGTSTGAGRRRRRKQGRRRAERQYGGCRVSAPGRNN